jgi:hypothetical protein
MCKLLHKQCAMMRTNNAQEKGQHHTDAWRTSLITYCRRVANV